MNETRKEYRGIVTYQVAILEWTLGHSVHERDSGVCPRCGESGTFDLHSLGFRPGAGNSIYYSTVFDEWRCRLCDFRMVA